LVFRQEKIQILLVSHNWIHVFQMDNGSGHINYFFQRFGLQHAFRWSIIHPVFKGLSVFKGFVGFQRIRRFSKDHSEFRSSWFGLSFYFRPAAA